MKYNLYYEIKISFGAKLSKNKNGRIFNLHMNNYLIKVVTIFLSLLIAGLAVFMVSKNTQVRNTVTSETQQKSQANNETQNTAFLSTQNLTQASSSHPQTILFPPISDAINRVTKKPFGIQVSPGNSPVSPERFSGYHTGVDFETNPDEQQIDVPIYAVCTGHLIMKKIASGYGGVAVQQCNLDNQTVTIIYGHLRFTSIMAKIGKTILAGDSFAVLGKGFSSETDGERKHLHLGIHKGSDIILLGYVQKQSDLSAWLDALKYLSQ